MADAAPNPVVLYDGVCNLCNNSVKFIIQHDRAAKFRFAPMQEPAGKALLKQYGLENIDMSTFVLIKEGKAYLRSTAWMEIVRELDGAWPILSVFRIVPPFVRDGAYNFIGSNRYKWFGKHDTCMVPTEDTKRRFLGWN